MCNARCLLLGALAGAFVHAILMSLPDSMFSFRSPLLLPLIVAALLAPCVFSRKWVASAAYFAVLLPAWL